MLMHLQKLVETWSDPYCENIRNERMLSCYHVNKCQNMKVLTDSRHNEYC